MHRRELEEIAAYWEVDPEQEPHLLPTIIQAATAPLVSTLSKQHGLFAQPRFACALTSARASSCYADRVPAQPLNWEEYEDLSSGSPYWYNVVTQETTWQHPDEIRYRNQLWALRSRYHYHHHDQQQQQRQEPDEDTGRDSFIARMEAQLSQHIEETAPSPGVIATRVAHPPSRRSDRGMLSHPFADAFHLAPIPTMEEVEQARRAHSAMPGSHFGGDGGFADDDVEVGGGGGQSGFLGGPRQSALTAVRSNRPRVTLAIAEPPIRSAAALSSFRQKARQIWERVPAD